MKWVVNPASLAGAATVPGDKSIAHRALMFAALADGESTIHNLPSGEDVLSTARCMTALGATIDLLGTTVKIRSGGQLRAPAHDLDAGNSGTTMRLLSGILAGQRFESCLDGDESLRGRPMGRVVDPLVLMGAEIATQRGYAPLHIRGSALRGITYQLPIASAQVKSAILFAGLFADGETCVQESVGARDHTERMMQALGLAIKVRDGRVSVTRSQPPRGFVCHIPGDMSSAAFLLGASALAGSEVSIDEVGLNPTRSAVLSVLERMGATVSTSRERVEAGEPRGTATVSGGLHRPIQIDSRDVPSLVDELPLIALLATQVAGESVIQGAAELRVKETDRITAVANELTTLGANITERSDGWTIIGPTKLRAAAVTSHGDHRIAMMLAVAGSVARGSTTIDGAEAASVSFPGFVGVFRALGGNIDAA